ncbi:MAG: hypothetical protein AAB966_00355 [Patescibacteria group bacterium]
MSLDEISAWAKKFEKRDPIEPIPTPVILVCLGIIIAIVIFLTKQPKQIVSPIVSSGIIKELKQDQNRITVPRENNSD